MKWIDVIIITCYSLTFTDKEKSANCDNCIHKQEEA